MHFMSSDLFVSIVFNKPFCKVLLILVLKRSLSAYFNTTKNGQQGDGVIKKSIFISNAYI